MADSEGDKLDRKLDDILREGNADRDAPLRDLNREAVLTRPAPGRIRWFWLQQVQHRELERVVFDLQELLSPDNEVKIISLIGMTGIGKTTLLMQLLDHLIAFYADGAAPSELPFIFVSAPANGDRSMSWTSLYRSILKGGFEPRPEKKRILKEEAGQVSRAKPKTLPDMREFIELLLRNRNVRVLVIDEALHLIRFNDYGATMDTLKSLADAYETKLVLVGHYNIAPLVTNYGQAVRRGEIIHYRRYDSKNAKDKKVFADVLKKLLALWPCKEVPPLERLLDELLESCLGSIGLLKMTLLRLLVLQLQAKGEKFAPEMLLKAFKSPLALKKLEAETVLGEETLKGACYGECSYDLEYLKKKLESA